MGSKGWVPRNSVERIGAGLTGVIVILGGLVIIAASFRVKAEIQSLIPTGLALEVFSLFIVTVALIAGFFALWLGSRLMAGSVRTHRHGFSPTAERESCDKGIACLIRSS
jgi:hypothetical protein